MTSPEAKPAIQPRKLSPEELQAAAEQLAEAMANATHYVTAEELSAVTEGSLAIEDLEKLSKQRGKGET